MTDALAAVPHHQPPGDPGARLAVIAAWIGTPEGRGPITPRAPHRAEQDVRVWDAAGVLGTRRIRIGRLLGAGLAGTVFEVCDDTGRRYVEKHFGEVPSAGAHRVGRKLTAAVLVLCRQAPLSFRELPQAVVAMHEINRLVVAASTRTFGAPITPPLLYTRYDARTGGYVQAFELVEGRPLRPWKPGLPLFGEAAVFLPLMRRWRDFLAAELGLWGLARQIDPANVNAAGNLWVTADRHVVLLDIVPGVPGLLEPRYLWLGMRRGELPPFADAVDLERLAAAVGEEELGLLRAALGRWQDAEPRLPSSPLRWWRVHRDARIRTATRGALITHLEVKGALRPPEAAAAREALARTGTFPARRRHAWMRSAPAALHRAVVDRVAAGELVRRLPKAPGRIARTGARVGRYARSRVERVVRALVRHLRSGDLRAGAFRGRVTTWIDAERDLGRLEGAEESELRSALAGDEDTADLAGLFAVHLSISAVKHTLFGPSLAWLGAAVATGRWWLAVPALVAPLLRVLTALGMGFGRRPGLLVLSALPDVGVLAAPLELIRRRPALGAFVVRMIAQHMAMKIPAFGQRGGMLEMASVAAVQVLVVAPARILPWAALGTLAALLLERWWFALAIFGLYAAAVAWGARHLPGGREPLAEARAGWTAGLPGRPASPA